MREDIEKLMAVHDGESAAQDADKVDEQSLDAESQAFLARLKEADKAFAAEADELLDMPVPSKLVDAIRKPQQTPTAKIIPFPQRRKAVVSFALAAGLAAVVATNTQLFSPATGPVLEFESADQRTLFQDTMNRVASGDLQASDDNSMSLMPVASFVAQGNVFCREFMAMQGETEYSGIACQNAGRWQLESAQITGGSTPDSDTYRIASGESSGAVTPSEIIRTAELSYTEEQAAIQAGWQQ